MEHRSITVTIHPGLYTADALLKIIEEMQLEPKCFPQFDLLEIVGEQGS
jgi:hypothetical protein